MIKEILNLPENMVGFKATGVVTKQDFEDVLLPAVKLKTSQIGELNYLLVLDTPLENFTAGAWIMDAWLGVKNLSKWKRGAIVSDSVTIKKFTEGFSYLVPGEFKGFYHEELDSAINWVSGNK